MKFKMKGTKTVVITDDPKIIEFYKRDIRYTVVKESKNKDGGQSGTEESAAT